MVCKEEEEVWLSRRKREGRDLIETETGKGKVDSDALLNDITHLHYASRCYSFSLGLARWASFHSHLRFYTTTRRSRERVAATHDTTRRCINGFLMIARSTRLISHIHHPGQAPNPRETRHPPWRCTSQRCHWKDAVKVHSSASFEVGEMYSCISTGNNLSIHTS